MKILRNVFMVLLALVLTVSVSSMLIINIVTSTILSKDYVLAKLDETNYYNKIYQYVQSNFEKYIHQSGLDEVVIEGLITEEQVKQDTQKIISNIYEKAQETIDTEQIKQKLNTNIDNFLEEQNISADKEDLESFVHTICEEYANSISHSKYEEKINNGYVKIVEILGGVKKAVLIGSIASAVLLLILSVKQFYNFFVYTGIASLASGLFLTFIKIYINLKIDVKNILILNTAFSDTLKNIISELLSAFIKNGCMLITAGVLLIIIPTLIHNFRNKEIEDKN